MTRRTKDILKLAVILVGMTALLVLAFDHRLTVSHYSVETGKVKGPIRLALISDFHGCDYGENQGQVLSALEAESPDAVLLCGDIFDDVMPPNNTVELVQRLGAKYLCYYVSGNHEFWSGQADGFKDVLADCGIAVLEGNSASLEVNGESICIAGIDDPATDYYPSRAPEYGVQMAALAAQGDPDIFTLLLSHRPEQAEALLSVKAELIVSGHAHGGQWRLPFVLPNGLFAPNQGLFPRHTSGVFDIGGTALVVSRGLARESTALPRIFNRPEIVMITVGERE